MDRGGQRRRAAGPARPARPTPFPGSADPELDRRARRHAARRRAARARRALELTIVAIGLVAIVAMAGTLIRGRQGEADTLTAAEILAGSLDGLPRAQTDPTPLCATFGTIQVRVPVDPPAVTVLAFHQASRTNARHLTPLVTFSSPTQVKHAVIAARSATATVAAAGPPDPASLVDRDGVYAGTCLKLWRSNRTGEPDTAIDVGANPGTDVYAPITGTVIAVRAYKLYQKYPDYEIHIRPDGHPELDCVLIHVEDVTTAVGDRVLAGVTRIACVRDLSKAMYLQLADYTHNGGTHCHIQLNAVDPANPLGEVDES